MLTAFNTDGKTIIARDATSQQKPFSCPGCRKEMVLKKGNFRVPHFAHIASEHCSYSNGESDCHREAKMAIYDALSRNPLVHHLHLEHHLGEVRPDICFCLREHMVAIEVQISPLSPNEINRRTLAYARKGMCVLWTPPIQETLLPQRTEMDENERYTPSAWERYLHVLYFGKVYYWHSGEKLLPIRYEDHFIHIKKWRDKGGYDRLSKKFKTPVVLPAVTITDLSPTARKCWMFRGIPLPEALLWG